MSLEVELKTYEERLPELLKDEGSFVVIAGKEIEGVFESYKDALAAGYKKCGLTPFLLKRIESIEQVYYFSRELTPCHT